jgi:large subunit ribosomal protein L32
MAQPKRRHSHARKNKRRSHDALKVDTLSTCPQCKEPKAPHRACSLCGYYGGRQVVKAAEE